MLYNNRNGLNGSRIRMDMVKKGDMMTVDDVRELLAVNLIGVVPDDEAIVISTNQGEPLVGMGPIAGQAYLNICRRIMGEEVPFLSLSDQPRFLMRLTSLLRRA